jgi:hypothetical protein
MLVVDNGARNLRRACEALAYLGEVVRYARVCNARGNYYRLVNPGEWLDLAFHGGVFALFYRENERREKLTFALAADIYGKPCASKHSLAKRIHLLDKRVCGLVEALLVFLK